MYFPKYFTQFGCTAGSCQDSCCRSGWEIVVDDESYERYKACDKDIDKNITAGSDGERVFKLGPDGSCPYLRDDGLCRLFILTGGKLSEICREYPRFIEEYDGFTETGISASCPEAQRLIFSASESDYELNGEKPSEELLEFLHGARRKVFDMISGSASAEKAAGSIVLFGRELQNLIDCGELSGGFDFPVSFGEELPPSGFQADVKWFAKELLDSTEILYPEWRRLLEEAARGGGKGALPDERTGKNYLKYLAFRFYLKAVSTENILAVSWLIYYAYRLCCTLSCGFEKAARLFSKEIEHDSENLYLLLERLEEPA